MAKQSFVSIVATQDDLCNWEFVNHFEVGIKGDEDDDERIYELVESIDSLSSSSDEEEEEEDDCGGEVEEGPTNDVSVPDHRVDDGLCSRVPDLGQNHAVYDDDLSNNGSILQLSGHQQIANDEEEDDDDDVDDGYGMDDELVPWDVKDRFVRQRIRKSGKISIGRSARSKKSALVFTRPGCVRGKHGLGLKVY